MNIQLEKHNELESSVIIDLVKDDYNEAVEKQIKKIQKTATIKGFRPGKAPMGMIKKMYGQSVLAEEIQRIASDKLNDYIKEEKLDILGYPITSSKVESKLDIENDEEFRFAFDLGLAPSFELNVSEKDKLELFKIEVGDKEIDEDIDYARKSHGEMQDTDTSDEESIVYANATELGEDGNQLDGGVSDKPLSFVPSMIEDKKLKKVFVGISKDFETTCDVKKLLNNNESVLSNALGLPKEGIQDLSDNFALKVTEVKTRVLPEINEDYFKRTFPENPPKDEKEYRERVKANLEKYYENEASLWLDHEIGHLIMKKHDFNLPDEFLKRWLTETRQKDYTPENIDEKYEQEKEALKRRLIIDKISAKFEIKAESEEIVSEAKTYFAAMYRQYGMNINAEDEFLKETVMKRLQDQEFIGQMNDRVIYRKAYDQIREMISVKEKKTNVENYFKHVNKHKEQHGE
ncbi:MAG: trigger factor [Bacteroidia bacterium]